MTLMLINSPEKTKELVAYVAPNSVSEPEAVASVTNLDTYKELGRVSLSASETSELEDSMRRHPAGSAFKHKKLMLQ